MYLTLFPKDLAKGRKFPPLILHKVDSFSIVPLFVVFSTKSLIKTPSTSVRRFLYLKFFYADTPSVQTCPPYTLGVSGDFCIRSPELKFLYTLCIWIRVDARIRIFLYTLTSQYQNQSFSARALLTNPLRCPDTNRIRVDGRIRFVWTQIFLYPHKKKKLRIQKSPDTYGRGLKAIDTYASQGCVLSACEAMG